MERTTPEEYFTIDFPAGIRITHYPSGDTCLRHMWMSGPKGQAAWEEGMREFFGRHPDCHAVLPAYGRDRVIDDVRSWPVNGGGFGIGDHVTVDGADGPLTRAVTGVKEAADGVSGDEGRTFILEDGAELRWSPDDDGWFTDDATPAGHGARARRTWPGDPEPGAERPRP